MASRNSFKQLEEEQMATHPHTPPEIEQNVMGNMRFVKTVGNVLELYLPKLFELMLALFGGYSKDLKEGGNKDSAESSPEGQSK
ncbi:MAG: hypothetical protein AAGG75_11660 [Bacteroidota bacterium]